MTSTIYLDTAAKVARAALTGTALPSVSAKLLSHLKLIIKCFAGADIVTVDSGTVKCVIKPKNAPSGAPSLIDTSAVFSGSGATAQYVFEWDSADSVALRAHIDAAADPTQPIELRCEVEYELDSNAERVAFPIHFETAYTRPEDPAPEANTDTSWEWLKLRAPETNGFSHDDEAKELTVAGGSGSGDVVGPASATDNAIVRFNGTGGKLVQTSGITIADGASGTLSGTNTGDQNTFSTVAVAGQSNVVADSATDTITLIAGSNITITTDAGNDSITINSTASGSGDVVGPSSSVDARPALFDGTTGKLLKQASAALGDAAFKATGTSAGTVAAGDDSRLSNARTPTAHAASHVNGTDDIQSATASQKGLATAAQISKLDGIEASADVTDAGNVGSTIGGADAETTINDSDKLPLTVSGVLKSIAYAAFKTLLNALYLQKSVYDPRGLNHITGAPGSDNGDQTGGTGGALYLDGGDASAGTGENGGAAGTIQTQGGDGAAGVTGGVGGSINTAAYNQHRGGDINTSATSSLSGGDITTAGGGSINTAGTGSIELGATGNRTTVVGAAVADYTLTLPTGPGTDGQLLKTNGAGATSWETLTIPDDAVTLAKMAPGTAGNLITFDASGNPAAVATGTAGQVLTSNGAGAAPTMQDVSSGLSNITETLHTASPNNTVNAEQLEVTGGTTNVDLVHTPKGTGAFIVGNEPDGTATGGDKRGTRAIDMQMSRSSSANVASGYESAIIGGADNIVTGQHSGVVAGSGNSISGAFSFAAGNNNAVTSNRSSAFGHGCVTSGAWGAFSTGDAARAYLDSMFAIASGNFAAGGDAQETRVTLRNKTTTNSAVELFIDGASVRRAIPSGKAMHALVKIIGIKSDGTATAIYMRQVAIQNVAGTTSLVGSVNTIGTDTAAGTSISITADDTNDSLKIEVTGITSETWRWVATVEGVEVAHGN